MAYYEAKGYRVIDARRTRASRWRSRRCARTRADRHAHRAGDRRRTSPGSINELDRPPIIMGHSFGGTLTQLLLDRGLGARGVVIDSAPTEGVRVNPLSQIKSLFPILKNPANRHKAVGLHARGVPLRVHEHAQPGGLAAGLRAVPHPRPRQLGLGVRLIANFKPGHQETWVDYKNADRAPLLFIAGGDDHIMPP